jgi:hypothetical protein
MLAVANEKATEATTARSREGKLRKMQPKKKLKIHPSQLSTLAALRYPSIAKKQQNLKLFKSLVSFRIAV